MDYREWEYNPENSDWIDAITGEVLTDYIMPSHLQAILSENIDLNQNYLF
ncbi:hypothetical protein [Spongiivirga citrea]|uniref:Uncharacterized protein n=1 Tax=Spongiivirga citrea TaxID=1481457 RepID=A0A6M0CJX5_9FLAO|nr:hypothetical protein [Spongiivirga citrea]NER16274.1 hypothetical protein [Spongiivirga citrea]